MTKKKAHAKLSIDDIALDNFPPRDFRVSTLSAYQDMTWDFTDSGKARLRGLTEAKLRIEWGTYSLEHGERRSALSDTIAKSHLDARLSDGVLEDLRLLSFVYRELPQTFPTRGRQVIRTKPQTVVTMARGLVLFFSTVDGIRQKRIAEHAPELPYMPIQSLSEVTYHDLEETLKVYTMADGRILEVGLRFLSSPVLSGKFAGASIQWTAGDIDNLKFNRPTPRDDAHRVMPDAMFRLLSNTASKDVACFLHALQLPRFDKTVSAAGSPHLPADIILTEAWEEYVEMRADDREYTAKLGHKGTRCRSRRKAFKTKHDMSMGDFFLYVQGVQRACMTLIGLYTGGRFSDFTSFIAGCVKEIHGMHMLIGTETKHQPIDAPENQDVWPAIPILRDAVICLEELSRVTYNPYLIGSSFTVGIGEEPEPMSRNGFTLALTDYFHGVDTDKRWPGWVINPHQLRHTLAHKLAQADVGVVYISYQLKHLYTALSAMPADVTIGYGNIGEQKLARAMAVKDLTAKAAKDLYHPDSPIAGGGAVEFRERRKVYFDGRVAQGWTEDEIIDQLASCGMPFVNVGAGYCGGVREETLNDGTSRPPPCIGNLQCNPGDCNQSIVTAIHIRPWQDIVTKNKEYAADPRLAHASENFKAAIAAGENVLRELGVGSST